MDSLLIVFVIVFGIIKALSVLVVYAFLFSSLIGLFIVGYIFWYVTVDYKIKNPILNTLVVYVPIILLGLFLFSLGESAFQQFPMVVQR